MEDHPPYEPSTPSTPPVIPWEDPSQPWPRALIDTVGAFLSNPKQAFERVPVRGDVLRPLVFALIVGWVGTFFYGLWEMTLGDPLRSMLPDNRWAGGGSVPRGYWFAMMALGPFFTAFGLVVSSAIAHLFLLLLGGAKNGFAATFRAMCYVQVATLALAVPFCGGLIGGIAVLAFEILGLSALHRISIGRAAVAVLLPTVLCCVCLFAVFLTAGAALMGAIGGLTR